jgi:hypothetical protein
MTEWTKSHALAWHPRTLVTQTYSLACSKEKFHANQHEKGGTKPKENFKKGCMPKGLELKREQSQVLTLEKHVMILNPPNY